MDEINDIIGPANVFKRASDGLWYYTDKMCITVEPGFATEEEAITACRAACDGQVHVRAGDYVA